jgi:dTDP-4-amino-4,6-dideoxygalactose transaminase
MPYYTETFGYRPGDLPAAEDVYARCLSLPLYPAMTRADVEYVVDTLRALLA